MKYQETEIMIKYLEQSLFNGFEDSEFNLIEISSLQITENKKGIISVMPVLKFVRNDKKL